MMKPNKATRSFVPNDVKNELKNREQKLSLLASRVLRNKTTGSPVPNLAVKSGNHPNILN